MFTLFILKTCRRDSPVSVQNLLFYQGRSDDVIGKGGEETSPRRDEQSSGQIQTCVRY